jgi:hypothetical protein
MSGFTGHSPESDESNSEPGTLFLLLSGFPTKMFNYFLNAPLHTTCPAISSSFGHSYNIFEDYNSSLFSFLYFFFFFFYSSY